MTDFKTCNMCGETKLKTDFSKRSDRPNGLQSRCCVCKRVENKAWREKNPDHNKKRMKVWREKNLDYQKKWVENNFELNAAMAGKSNAIKRTPDCIPDDFDLHATVPIYAERIRLTQETGVVHHVDHIIPLADGGKHEASNLQVLTAEENYTKEHNRRKEA